MESELLFYAAAAAALYYFYTAKGNVVDPKPIVDDDSKPKTQFNAVKIDNGEHNTSETGKYQSAVGGMPENAAAAMSVLDITKMVIKRVTSRASALEVDSKPMNKQ
jgi:hypothetical protein